MKKGRQNAYINWMSHQPSLYLEWHILELYTECVTSIGPRNVRCAGVRLNNAAEKTGMPSLVASAGELIFAVILVLALLTPLPPGWLIVKHLVCACLIYVYCVSVKHTHSVNSSRTWDSAKAAPASLFTDISGFGICNVMCLSLITNFQKRGIQLMAKMARNQWVKANFETMVDQIQNSHGYNMIFYGRTIIFISKLYRLWGSA